MMNIPVLEAPEPATDLEADLGETTKVSPNWMFPPLILTTCMGPTMAGIAIHLLYYFVLVYDFFPPIDVYGVLLLAF